MAVPEGIITTSDILVPEEVVVEETVAEESVVEETIAEELAADEEQDQAWFASLVQMQVNTIVWTKLNLVKHITNNARGAYASTRLVQVGF